MTNSKEDGGLVEKAFNAAFEENKLYKPDIDRNGLYCFVSYYESAKGGFQQATEWQPIATAPEKGAFLAYCRWYMVSAKDIHAPYWTNWMPRHSWMCLGQVQGEGSLLSYVDRVEATHWMPLPKPPQDEPEGEST